MSAEPELHAAAMPISRVAATVMNRFRLLASYFRLTILVVLTPIGIDWYVRHAIFARFCFRRGF